MAPTSGAQKSSVPASSSRWRVTSTRRDTPTPRSTYRLSQYRSSATRLSIALLQHPGVLGAAALRAVHHERPAAQRDAGEAARGHPDVPAVQDERPEVHVTAFEMVDAPGRMPRQRERRLGDVPAWILLDARAV